MRTIFSPLMTTARNSNKYLALRFLAGELFTCKKLRKTAKKIAVMFDNPVQYMI